MPWLTLAVCALCVAVYAAQHVVDTRTSDAARTFCSSPGSDRFESLMNHLVDDYGVDQCMELMERIRQSRDPRVFVTDQVVRNLRPTGTGEAVGQLVLVRAVMDRFVAYEASVPSTLTASLFYRPTRFDPQSMLVATFAHGSVGHLLNNVLFFFAFAAVLEVFISRRKYVLVFLASAVGAFSAYLLSALGGYGQNPTVGLSGVVYGMMAVIAWMSPRVVVLIPLGLMGVWYVGQDILALVLDAGASGVNLTAHVGGAVSGLVVATLALRGDRAALAARGRQATDNEPQAPAPRPPPDGATPVPGDADTTAGSPPDTADPDTPAAPSAPERPRHD